MGEFRPFDEGRGFGGVEAQDGRPAGHFIEGWPGAGSLSVHQGAIDDAGDISRRFPQNTSESGNRYPTMCQSRLNENAEKHVLPDYADNLGAPCLQN